MRLATLAVDGRTAAAVLDGDEAVIIDSYRDVGALLVDGLEAAERALASGSRRPFVRVDLLRPVLEPGAIFCVGLNYRTHILEMGRELPDDPTLFAKLARSLTDPFADVELPQVTPTVDYEGELVVVIGAGGGIAGYTIMNDVSMRQWQYRTLQWFAGKNFVRSTPVGPWLVTPDDVDLATAKVRVSVNGEPRQQAPLGELLFDAARLIDDISTFTTLEPGDLIATGTPGGVGHGMEPPSYLRDGDVVEVAIDGIGALSNRFVSA